LEAASNLKPGWRLEARNNRIRDKGKRKKEKGEKSEVGGKKIH